MEHSQKVLLTPSESGKVRIQPFETEKIEVSEDMKEDKKKGNRIREHALERNRRLIGIVLKLAEIKGYNDKFQIRNTDGRYLPNSDVITLVLHSISQGRSLEGLREFAALLKEANVNPEFITNENVRALMKAPIHRSTPQIDIKPTVTSQLSEPVSRKRKVEYLDANEIDPRDVPLPERPIAVARKRVLAREEDSANPPKIRKFDWDGSDSELDE